MAFGRRSSQLLTEVVTRLKVAAAWDWRPSFARYGWALAASAGTLCVSVGVNAAASRALGPAGFGQFAVGVTSLTLLGTAMGLGMPVTMVRFWTHLAPGAEAARQQSRLAAWTLVTAGAILFGSGFLVVQGAFPRLLNSWVPAGTAAALVLAGIGAAITQMAAAEAQMSLDFRRYFGALVGSGGARLVGLVAGLVIASSGSVQGALIGVSGASLLAGTILAWSALVRGRPYSHTTLGDLGSAARTLVGFGLPILGSTFVVAAIEYLDILVIATTLSPHRVGLYGAAVRLSVIQTTALGALTALALPLATRADAAGARSTFLRKTVSVGAPVGLLATLLLGLLSPLLVRLVYGLAYAESAHVFLILSVGLMPNFVGNPASQLIYAAGAPGFLLLVHVGQLLALLVGLPAVATRWDIVGVATYRSAVNLVAVLVIVMRVFALSRARAPSVSEADWRVMNE